VLYLSHVTSCTPTKFNLYLANFLAVAVSELALYRLLTFLAPNLMSHFHCLGRIKVSVRVRGFVCEHFATNIRFYSAELLRPRPTPKLEDHHLSAFRECLLNIFAATPNIKDRSSIRNPRTRHAVTTGTHLQHGRNI
jgi:hypothetical protein